MTPWHALPLLLSVLVLVLTMAAPLATTTSAQEIEPRGEQAEDAPADAPVQEEGVEEGLQDAPVQEFETPGSDWSPPSRVYLSKTGHTLDQLFLDLWRNAGGASAFGYPITAEIEQPNGHIIQYLQYARFEYWPEGDASGNQVILGKLGEEMRPVTVQRPMASLASNQGDTSTSSAVEAARFAQAWLPLAENDVRASATYIPETRHSLRLGFLDFWERTGGADFLGNPLTEEYDLAGITYQIFERGQLARENEGDPYMIPIGRRLAEKYGLDQSPIAQGDVPTYSEELWVPPVTPTPASPPAITTGFVPGGEELWMDVNLTTQYMIVYQGDRPILETLVSTGREKFATPPGTFFINTKVDVQDMEGVLGGESYNVPSVPWVMYFTDVGHAIHGAYWHNNFGAVMSHGCINLPVDVAEYLYGITTVGVRVEIHN